jgi:hypothetical protein
LEVIKRYPKLETYSTGAPVQGYDGTRVVLGVRLMNKQILGLNGWFNEQKDNLEEGRSPLFD